MNIFGASVLGVSAVLCYKYVPLPLGAFRWQYIRYPAIQISCVGNIVFSANNAGTGGTPSASLTASLSVPAFDPVVEDRVPRPYAGDVGVENDISPSQPAGAALLPVWLLYTKIKKRI